MSQVTRLGYSNLSLKKIHSLLDHLTINRGEINKLIK